MELTERKKKVLRSIVDLYIRTAEPVGSKAIAELPDMNYSSATIRNEMADLTTLGYLEQPHTSAGRIPSAAGYRLYVDELMMDYRLSMDETKSINIAIEEKMQKVDKLVEKVAKLVSQATDLPAISMAARQVGTTARRFELITAGEGSFILVVMLSTDEVVNKLIKLPVPVEEGDLKVLSALLNATMTGLTPDGFTPDLLERLMNSAGPASALVPVIVEFTTETLRRQGSANMAVAGQVHGVKQHRGLTVREGKATGIQIGEHRAGHTPGSVAIATQGDRFCGSDIHPGKTNANGFVFHNKHLTWANYIKACAGAQQKNYLQSSQKATALAAATFRESTPWLMGISTV